MSTPEQQAALMAWADAQSLAGRPLSLRETFLAGIEWARANPPRRRRCTHENCDIVAGEPGGPYRYSCGSIEG